VNPAPTTARPGTLVSEVQAINDVLRTELAAVETYEQVLTHFEGHHFASELRTIRYAHETAVDGLRNHVRNLGGEPVEAEPTVRLHASVGTTGSPDAILDELRRAEEQGVAAYERLLQREQMPEECRFAIKVEQLAHCHEHIDTLAGMAAALAKKG
jgi:bacterioferritin (cytochrome b1)